MACDECRCRFADILRCRETILPLVFGALVHNTRVRPKTFLFCKMDFPRCAEKTFFQQGEDGNGGHWSSNVEMLSFVRFR